MRGCPLKKTMQTRKFGTGTGAKGKEKKMSCQRMDLRVSDSTLSAIKKRAFSDEKSAFEGEK
jgi:predicted DNA binding CopG/RHH family protein